MMSSARRSTDAKLRGRELRLRGEPLSPRATETIRRLYESANRIFVNSGYHDATENVFKTSRLSLA